MRASVVSARRRVTATISAPWPLMVPANTSSPSALSTGSDSPVIGAWLTSERPFLTMPSSASFSPGLTIINAPGSTCSMSRRRSPRSSRMSTSVEARSSSLPIAFLARSRLCASSHCAAANSDTTIAASSNWRIAIAPTTATTIKHIDVERTSLDRLPRAFGREHRSDDGGGDEDRRAPLGERGEPADAARRRDQGRRRAGKPAANARAGRRRLVNAVRAADVILLSHGPPSLPVSP